MLFFFFSFSCLIALAKASKTRLNKNGKNGYLCFVPNLRRKAFSFLLLSKMLPVSLSHMAYVTLRHIPFIATLLRVFNHEKVLNFFQVLFLHLLTYRLTFYHCVTTSYILFKLLSKVYYVWHMYIYFSLLLFPLARKTFHPQSVCPEIWSGTFYVEPCRWVLFFNPFSHSASFDWWI